MIRERNAVDGEGARGGGGGLVSAKTSVRLTAVPEAVVVSRVALAVEATPRLHEWNSDARRLMLETLEQMLLRSERAQRATRRRGHAGVRRKHRRQQRE